MSAGYRRHLPSAIQAVGESGSMYGVVMSRSPWGIVPGVGSGESRTKVCVRTYVDAFLLALVSA